MENVKYRGIKKLTCIKCLSRKNNLHLKEKNYYKEYFQCHKDPNAKSRGRPMGSKNKDKITVEISN